MPLQLLPLEESDLEADQHVSWSAFKDGLMGLMFPDGYTEAARKWEIETAIIGWRRHPDVVKKMKVIDTDLPSDGPYGNIVSIAHWKFYVKDRTDEELEQEKKESGEEGIPPDINLPLVEEYIGVIGNHKKEIMGNKAYVYLSFLATRPEHQRRGAGAMQLKWGSEKADELGLPMYLESSPKGRPLYERLGYRKMREVPFDTRKWGMEENCRMIACYGRRTSRMARHSEIDLSVRLALWILLAEKKCIICLTSTSNAHLPARMT